jgi:mannose-1-phosphate guanylyltransferase
MFYALIMAGGSGTRLWPLSRSSRPKQALELVGDRSMFQHAVDRLKPLFPAERILVVTRAEYAAVLGEQTPELPPSNFIIEPEGRGTAAAIGLGAVHLLQRDPQAVMAVLTADHFITDTHSFRQALSAAEQLALDGHLVTMGIHPTYPSTGFGYIHQGQPVRKAAELQAYQVERFVEKPQETSAVQMVASAEYSWNSGMFIWRATRILEEFERQMGDFYSQLMNVTSVIGTNDYKRVLEYTWPRVAKQTIDYGIMEGARDVVVLPVEIGWSDVGSWANIAELLPKDAQGNACNGPHIEIDTQHSLLFGKERLIATIGLNGMVIVDTPDALLVCPIEREQEVRDMVKKLETQQLRRWL